MPLKSQGYCGFGRRLSGLHCFWCNGRGPHLEWSQEPQGSSPFLTLIAGSLQSWDRRVRPCLEWRNGTLLSSQVVHGMTVLLSSCVWNLRFYRIMHGGVSAPSCCAFTTGLLLKRCSGIGFFSRVGPEIGVFRHVTPPTRLCVEFPRETGVILRCAGNVGNPF